LKKGDARKNEDNEKTEKERESKIKSM